MSQLTTEIIDYLWLWPDLGIFLLLGLVAGVLAGLLGVGGGLIIVPVLLWLFQSRGFSPAVVMHLAVGTSLATIVITSISSLIAHHLRGAVLWPLVARLTTGIVVGALVGAAIADLFSSIWLQRLFACFVIFIGLKMVSGMQVEARRELPGRGGMFLASSMIGAVSAMTGIGGGSLTVPFLHWNSISIRNAVATSSACGLPIALAGMSGFLIAGLGDAGLPPGSTGFVYWPALPGITIATLLSAPLGARLAHTISAGALQRVFALLLLFVGVKLLLGG
jgi:uncharacterized membrane protein YfcA